MALLAREGAARCIFIADLDVACRIGIHDFERAGPQRVLVNVELYLDPAGAPARDRIEDAVDYDGLREGIVRIAGSRHFELQETLAGEIMDLCLSLPGAIAALVSTEKPDVYPDTRAVGYALFRRA
jgi:dihydroneopterin aldolase